jgi:AP2-associated kinase
MICQVKFNQYFSRIEIFIYIYFYKKKGSERARTARNEMEILRKLPKSENIMKFFDGIMTKTDSETTVAIFLLEFCSGGSVFDLMTKYDHLEEKQIIQIIRDAA